MGPDDQVVREHHDLQPHLVERERLERELAPGRCPCRRGCGPRRGRAGGDDARGPRCRGSVWSVRIAWKRYPSWSVNDSCAPGCGRSRRTITRDPSGQVESSRRSVISTTSPFSRSVPSWSSAGTQASSGVWRIAARTVLGQLVAEREPQVRPHGSDRRSRASRRPNRLGSGSRCSRSARRGSARAPGRSPSRDRRRCSSRRSPGAAASRAPPGSHPRTRRSG